MFDLQLVSIDSHIYYIYTAARIRYHILMLIILNVTVVRLKGLRSLMSIYNVKSSAFFVTVRAGTAYRHLFFLQKKHWLNQSSLSAKFM